MNTFRKDGVYFKMHDAVKEGYYTMEKGKMKKHKYGIIDKLYDIYKYGKTNSISYSYIYFYHSKSKNETQLFLGSIVGEMTEILATWKNSHFTLTNHPHRQVFCFVNDDTIK